MWNKLFGKVGNFETCDKVSFAVNACLSNHRLHFLVSINYFMARMTECPSIVDANPESQDLSYKKRLELLENDAQSLYKFCISKGFSTNQMKTCLTPLLGKQKPLVTRIAAGSSRSIFKLSILIGVVAMLYGWPTSNKMVNVHVRLLSVKVTIRVFVVFV